MQRTPTPQSTNINSGGTAESDLIGFFEEKWYLNLFYLESFHILMFHL